MASAGLLLITVTVSGINNKTVVSDNAANVHYELCKIYGSQSSYKLTISITDYLEVVRIGDNKVLVIRAGEQKLARIVPTDTVDTAIVDGQ